MQIKDSVNFCPGCGLKQKEQAGMPEQQIQQPVIKKYHIGSIIFNVIVMILAVALLLLLWHVSRTAF
jgi:hypothetical protein